MGTLCLAVSHYSFLAGLFGVFSGRTRRTIRKDKKMKIKRTYDVTVVSAKLRKEIEGVAEELIYGSLAATGEHNSLRDPWKVFLRRKKIEGDGMAAALLKYCRKSITSPSAHKRLVMEKAHISEELRMALVDAIQRLRDERDAGDSAEEKDTSDWEELDEGCYQRKKHLCE